MDHYELYKELYHKENERVQEVYNSLNIPLAVITALSTVIYFLVTTFVYSVSIVWVIIFIISISITIVLLLLSIFFLTKAFVNFSRPYEYTGIAYPRALFEWHKDLSKYYELHYQEEEGMEKMADNHFKNHLIEQYIEHVNHNMVTNDLKFSQIFNSKKFLTGSLLCIILTTIPYTYSYFHKVDEVHKVFLINQANTSKSDTLLNSNFNNSNMNYNLTSKPTPPPPPPSRLIREGTVPPPPSPPRPSKK